MNRKLDKKERLIFFRNSSIVLLLLFIGFGPCFLNMDVAFVGQIQIAKNHKTKINDEKNISEINQYKQDKIEWEDQSNAVLIPKEDNVSSKKSIKNHKEVFKSMLYLN
jgi:hypothetical protein